MNKHYLWLAAATIMMTTLASCNDSIIKEREIEQMESGNRIQLSLSETENVAVYSTATESENNIHDCVVLAFRGSSSTPANSEFIDVSKIVHNGQASPILPQLSFELQAGDRVYVICNTKQTAVPSGVTENNFNGKFRDNNKYYKAGDPLPMFGKIDSYSATNTICVMTRSVAKVQVKMGTSVQDNTGTFNVQNIDWMGRNIGISNNIEPQSVPYGTPLASGVNDMQKSFRLVQYEGVTAEDVAVYINEYPSSIIDINGATIDKAKFNAKRTHILLTKTVNGTKYYYRLDFYDKAKKEYLDVLRNHHYTFVINKVKSEGYLNKDEAINNPGSNLEYTIETTDNREQYIISNGQYAIDLSNDGKIIVGPKGKYEIAKVKYQLGENLTAADVNITTNSISGAVENTSAGTLSMPTSLSTTQQSIMLDVKDNTSHFKGYVTLKLGNLTKQILIERFPTDTIYASHTLTGANFSSVQWLNNGAGASLAKGTNNPALNLPKIDVKDSARAMAMGNYTATISGASITSKLCEVEIQKPGRFIESIIDFEPLFAQNTYLYLSNNDADNSYKGNGWVDDPTWVVTSPKDFSLDVFKFKTRFPTTLSIPKTADIKVTNSSVGVDSWKNKTGTQINGATINLPAGVDVTIDLNFAQGEFAYTLYATETSTGIAYPMLVEKHLKVSYLGKKNFITGYSEFLGYSDISLGSGYGTGSVLDISEASSNKKMHINTTSTVVTNASHATTDKELGYRAGRALVKMADGKKSTYYVAQTGLGFAGDGIIRMAEIKANGNDWGYYIRANDPSIDNQYARTITNPLMFMIGKTEGLEVPPGTALGASWNSLSQRHSWSEDKQSYSSYSAPNSNGLYLNKNKPYGNFAYNGKDCPCRLVYPKGYWRKPTDEELKSWSTPVGSTTSAYPIAESYDAGIKMRMPNGEIIYIKPPYMLDSQGRYGICNTPGRNLKAIMIGTKYYLLTNKDAQSSYPGYWENPDTNQKIPAADTESGYGWRDACGVFCIRN